MNLLPLDIEPHALKAMMDTGSENICQLMGGSGD